MFPRGSRYEFVKPLKVHDAEQVTLKVTRARDVKTEPGVIEHTLTEGDRLDLLALHYYNDDRKWWLILDANPEISYAGELEMDQYVGTRILIPRDTKRGALR